MKHKAISVVDKLANKGLIPSAPHGYSFFQILNNRNIIMTTAILGGFFVLSLPILVANSIISKNELEGTILDEHGVSQINDNPISQQNTIGTEASPEITVPSQPEVPAQPEGGSSASVSITSTMSSSDGVTTQSHTVNETINGESRQETITKTSEDGDSKVNFSYDVDADSRVTVRERGDKLDIDIDIDERTRIRN